ncbi:MAG TPA: PTS sugar transporter subunit IIA [Phycisphaerae bacterium]|jgi:fructose-specific phosphotransferase system IIA component|nr:PTS sugar transporter subunit IIA [Phycisphaerae bacterium]
MRLSDILKIQHIKVPLAAKNKKDAIAELVGVLAEAKDVKDANILLNSVLEREATRTTGIGNGLAIPHGKCAGVDHLVVAIGKPAEPIDFESIDKRPVNLIVLLASPPDQTGPHIQALARISRLMNVEGFRTAMRQATSPQQVLDAVVAQEATMGTA